MESWTVLSLALVGSVCVTAAVGYFVLDLDEFPQTPKGGIPFLKEGQVATGTVMLESSSGAYLATYLYARGNAGVAFLGLDLPGLPVEEVDRFASTDALPCLNLCPPDVANVTHERRVLEDLEDALGKLVEDTHMDDALQSRTRLNLPDGSLLLIEFAHGKLPSHPRSEVPNALANMTALHQKLLASCAKRAPPAACNATYVQLSVHGKWLSTLDVPEQRKDTSILGPFEWTTTRSGALVAAPVLEATGATLFLPTMPILLVLGTVVLLVAAERVLDIFGRGTDLPVGVLGGLVGLAALAIFAWTAAGETWWYVAVAFLLLLYAVVLWLAQRRSYFLIHAFTEVWFRVALVAALAYALHGLWRVWDPEPIRLLQGLLYGNLHAGFDQVGRGAFWVFTLLILVGCVSLATVEIHGCLDAKRFLARHKFTRASLRKPDSFDKLLAVSQHGTAANLLADPRDDLSKAGAASILRTVIRSTYKRGRKNKNDNETKRAEELEDIYRAVLGTLMSKARRRG